MTCLVCGHESTNLEESHECGNTPGSAAALAPQWTPYLPERRATTRAWEAMTWTVTGVIATFVLAGVAQLIVRLYGYAAMSELPAYPVGADVVDIQILGLIDFALSALAAILFCGCLVGYFVWFSMTRKAVRRLGADPRQVLRHWTVYAWRIAILAYLAVACLASGSTEDLINGNLSRDALLSLERTLIVFMSVRVAISAFLIVVIWVLRKRIHATAGPSGASDNAIAEAAAAEWRSARRF